MNSKYADCLTSLKNTKEDEISSYPQQAIAQAFLQINQCYNEIRQLGKRSMEEQNTLSEDEKIFLKGKMVVKIDTIHRLKRFLLIVFENREHRIEELFWNFGGELRKQELANLHEKEKKYLLDYKNLVNSYIEDVGLELTMNLHPPLDTIVQIRVLKDCGEIVEQGITLEKNSVHFIKKRLVEKFIQRGDVVIIH